jgi:hypothetical protein
MPGCHALLIPTHRVHAEVAAVAAEEVTPPAVVQVVEGALVPPVPLVQLVRREAGVGPLAPRQRGHRRPRQVDRLFQSSK